MLSFVPASLRKWYKHFEKLLEETQAGLGPVTKYRTPPCGGGGGGGGALLSGQVKVRLKLQGARSIQTMKLKKCRPGPRREGARGSERVRERDSLTLVDCRHGEHPELASRHQRRGRPTGFGSSLHIAATAVPQQAPKERRREHRQLLTSPSRCTTLLACISLFWNCRLGGLLS